MATREPGVAPERPRRGIFSCWLETIARGCRAPGSQRPRIWEAPLWNCVSTQPGISKLQRIYPEPQMRSVRTRPPLRAWQGPPPRRPGLGRAPFGPSLRSSPEPDFVFFPPSSQPQEASCSFLSGSGAGSPILTCARTVEGGRAALPQWQPAASSQEALRRQERRGGGAAPGRGRGGGGAAVAGDRPLGRVKSSTFASPSLFQPTPPPSRLGAGQEGVHCLTVTLLPSMSRPRIL